MVHCHTVHLPRCALLIPYTVWGTGSLTSSLAALAAQVSWDELRAMPEERMFVPLVNLLADPAHRELTSGSGNGAAAAARPQAESPWAQLFGCIGSRSSQK